MSVKTINKVIPESIQEEAQKALSYFPELAKTPITFQFKEQIKKSTMQAQPTWASFLKSRKQRSYIILMSRKIQIEEESFTLTDIPSEVLIGWLGHELGHVMDYRHRSSWSMLIFGLKYLYSHAHIQEVERAADTYAVAHGMGDYILKTKDFILNHAQISEQYKDRMRKLYLSPEEIMHLINEHEIENALA